MPLAARAAAHPPPPTAAQPTLHPPSVNTSPAARSAAGVVELERVEAVGRLKELQRRAHLACSGSGDRGHTHPYTTLGLSRSCSTADARQAFRNLQLRFHPDKVVQLLEKHRATLPTLPPRAELERLGASVILELVNANVLLNDPKQRALFDASGGENPRSAAGAAPPPPPPQPLSAAEIRTMLADKFCQLVNHDVCFAHLAACHVLVAGVGYRCDKVVVADGNCFFHSIQHARFGHSTTTDYIALRTKVMQLWATAIKSRARWAAHLFSCTEYDDDRATGATGPFAQEFPSFGDALTEDEVDAHFTTCVKEFNVASAMIRSDRNPYTGYFPAALAALVLKCHLVVVSPLGPAVRTHDYLSRSSFYAALAGDTRAWPTIVLAHVVYASPLSTGMGLRNHFLPMSRSTHGLAIQWPAALGMAATQAAERAEQCANHAVGLAIDALGRTADLELLRTPFDVTLRRLVQGATDAALARLPPLRSVSPPPRPQFSLSTEGRKAAARQSAQRLPRAPRDVSPRSAQRKVPTPLPRSSQWQPSAAAAPRSTTPPPRPTAAAAAAPPAPGARPAAWGHVHPSRVNQIFGHADDAAAQAAGAPSAVPKGAGSGREAAPSGSPAPPAAASTVRPLAQSLHASLSGVRAPASAAGRPLV